MSSCTFLLFASLLAAESTAGDANLADRIAEARQHLQSGRYAEAIEAYQELDSADDTTPDQRAAIAVARSQALEQTGESEQALSVVEDAVEQTPDSPPLLARLAEIQYLRGDYASAQDSVDAALKSDPDLPLAHLVQAHLHRETGELDAALEEYRWCVRFYNRAQPDDAETLIVLAQGSVEYARWRSVSSIFRFVVNTLCPDALTADEHCWQANWLGGALLLEKYNQAQALPELNAALAINPHAAPVLVELGVAALQELELEQADDYADRALAANPRLPAALHLKADVLLTASATTEALAHLETALEVNPHDQRTLARQAACYLLEDGVPPDDELLNLFLHLDAIDQFDIDQPSRFSQVLIGLARRNPRPGYFLTIVGGLLDQHRRYAAAEKFYRQAIHVMPQLAEPRTNLGMLYMRTGRVEEAERILDEAFDADPFHVRVSNMRKVIGVLNTYDVVSTDHFVLRVDQSNRLLAGYMADYLESIYPELTQRYDYEPPLRTQFEIYSAAKGQGAHQWFSARMIGLPWIQTIGASTGMIVALASPTDTEPFNWARVLRHEFVHILTLQETRFNIPHWYTEALAVHEEGLDMPEQWQNLLLHRVPAGDVFNLQTVNSGFQRPEGPTDWQMAYCQSHLYARYMTERFGDDALTNLLDAYRKNLSTSQAIPEVFSVSLEDFEAGYTTYLNRIVDELRPLRSAPYPSLEETQPAYDADNDDPAAAGRHALALLADRQVRAAAPIAKAANEADPTQPEAAYVLARFAIAKQNDERAIELLQTALDEKDPHGDVLAQLARLRLDARADEEAARLYQIGVNRFPLEDRYWHGLALALWRMDETDRLRPVLETLAERDFDNPAFRKKLAEIALAEARYEDAIAWGMQALYIDIEDVDVHQTLAEAYLHADQPEKARRELEAVLTLDPRNEQASTMLKTLEDQ
ncbi:MAG: hypothetical protein DWQ45_04185 [Planctomycetota bacterium]|nr:MAG: hypothetical protein DWQ41_15405 [Planctomycetota bacterium]REK38593.1 MAG: hypothetical protein DWQ45_04185 [Planctomycetota bacterium]